MQDQINSVPTACAACAAHGQLSGEPTVVAFQITSSPFCQEEIRLAAERQHDAIDVAVLNAQLRASQLANAELFCLLAQSAPEVLPAAWSRMLDLVAADHRLWVCQEMTVGELEDGTGEMFGKHAANTR